jgi:cysteine sulfinate desulfinase/cysteine desulfurase-like protein
MGFTREEALSSIRLSLGFASTEADVDRALEVVPTAVDTLRQASAARAVPA